MISTLMYVHTLVIHNNNWCTLFGMECVWENRKMVKWMRYLSEHIKETTNNSQNKLNSIYGFDVDSSVRVHLTKKKKKKKFRSTVNVSGMWEENIVRMRKIFFQVDGYLCRLVGLKKDMNVHANFSFRDLT